MKASWRAGEVCLYERVGMIGTSWLVHERNGAVQRAVSQNLLMIPLQAFWTVRQTCLDVRKALAQGVWPQRIKSKVFQAWGEGL
jgi:hypothetical protein